ncbi:Glyoxalase/Bleomycin resistance protein/Dioxygenase superfamily protein [Streptomyces sp. YIM 130001]|uniref:VOC family protein n=1 Tax=Streptomyces sp. YIM 130001 TaxID=2259644 RepID=UPI000E655E09|nr:VOC family protein [Streptomyces sp. YIM 130001]RII18334.1 Glyoxalase/Bleomycin resistance protein/Dioxygenase superfamily protein [Streptomyces sp. YIM 130001]
MIKVAMTSVYVEDVGKAHAFYTDVLGFETRNHLDMGDGTPFVTIGAAGAQRDLEVLLEPGGSTIAQTYTAALREAGLPCIVCSVDDVKGEYERLSDLGVRFSQEPHREGPVLTTVLDDTVGNLVQLIQVG